LREYAIPNVCGVIITSNHKTNGIYLPPDDRRHYVGWSSLTKEDFPTDYWRALYGWYGSAGIDHVAAYLAALDLSRFDPKAPPPQTAAFWEIVQAGAAPEDAELADVIDDLGRPDVLTLTQVSLRAAAAWCLAKRPQERQARPASDGTVRVSRRPEPGHHRWALAGRRKTAGDLR
jgi:hypothetical protein